MSHRIILVRRRQCNERRFLGRSFDAIAENIFSFLITTAASSMAPCLSISLFNRTILIVS